VAGDYTHITVVVYNASLCVGCAHEYLCSAAARCRDSVCCVCWLMLLQHGWSPTALSSCDSGLVNPGIKAKLGCGLATALLAALHVKGRMFKALVLRLLDGS
jgi:hypothetical protein